MRAFLFATSSLVVAALFACSSSSTEAPAAPAANDGGSSDSATDVAALDAGIESFNGCMEADFAANDRTAESAERIFRGPETDAGAIPFDPRCMRIRVNQTVVWKVDSSYGMSWKAIATEDGGFSPDAGASFVLDEKETTMSTKEPEIWLFSCPDYPIMAGALQVVR